jgi:hypothetical protein
MPHPSKRNLATDQAVFKNWKLRKKPFRIQLEAIGNSIKYIRVKIINQTGKT